MYKYLCWGIYILRHPRH